MRRKPVQFLVLMFAALLVVAAAGCGGSKKAASTTTTTTSTTSTTTTTTSSTASTASTSTSTEATTTTAASGLGTLASAANCAQLQNVGAEFANALQGTNGDMSKSAAIFKEFADKTPSDIRPDFETIADALQKYADALKGIDLTGGKVPDAATIAKLTQISQSLDNAKLTQAEQHISAWAAQNCHA
jgi:hypothetical protein